MSDHATARQSHGQISWLGAGLCVVALPPLIYYGNPAVALLTGAAIAVSLDRQPFPNGAVLGRLALQAAIVLLGLKLDLATLWSLSARFTGGVAAYVLITLGLGLLLGRALKVDGPSSGLISAGTAICGGTAIATLSGVLGARAQQTAVAMAVVLLLNAVALVVFPLVGAQLEMSQTAFGLWAAVAIHDTSSVVATAASYGDESAAVATTLKLVRTLWLLPVLLVAAWYAGTSGTGERPRLRVPGFIVGFVAAAAVGSFVPLPRAVISGAGMLAGAALVLALFLVGTELTRATMAQIRGRVLWQALVLWAVVAPGTLLVILNLPLA